jgi:hypothetical protein
LTGGLSAARAGQISDDKHGREAAINLPDPRSPIPVPFKKAGLPALTSLIPTFRMLSFRTFSEKK